ncbi:hypothetical protein [Streptomyces xantholiticus]|uniref:Uncharacterized protein n=1 Tax=Streptomyces xantholiticus TaxID=68285 RepID=A0ABV1UU71_9ACTN
MSSYAFPLTDGDELIPLRWGAHVTVADAEAPSAQGPPPWRAFESPLDDREEYAARR